MTPLQRFDTPYTKVVPSGRRSLVWEQATHRGSVAQALLIDPDKHISEQLLCANRSADAGVSSRWLLPEEFRTERDLVVTDYFPVMHGDEL